ncbi:MAG: DUF4349 domain-containing protein [Candidatus Nanopelagicales bacterium]
MRTRRLIITALISTAMTLTLASCGSGDSVAEYDMAAGPEAAVAEAPMMDEAVRAPEEASTVDSMQERSIIRRAYVSLRVEAVSEAVADIRDLVSSYDGVIAAENVSGADADRYATVTAQIPADALDAFLPDVTALGDVESMDISSEDVTTQVIDLDARIAALQTSIERLTQLLTDADRVEDLIAVESELARRQADLDSLTSQRAWLSDQVAMSTVTISLSPITRVADVETPGFLSGLASGWSALVALVGFGFTALGFLLPFILIALVVAVPVTVLLVRRSRRRRKVEGWAGSEHGDVSSA